MSFSVPCFSKKIEYTSPTGVKTTLYSIGTLADALGRTSQTVRKWEVGGIIPKTPFTVNGVRMYSTEHIEAIVRGAEKSRIKQGSSICDTAFSKRVYSDFERLHQHFFVKKEENYQLWKK